MRTSRPRKKAKLTLLANDDTPEVQLESGQRHSGTTDARGPHGCFSDLDAFSGTYVINLYVRGKRIGRWEATGQNWDDDLLDALEAYVERQTPAPDLRLLAKR